MDVAASRHIDAPPDKVSKIMFDPLRDPEWIGGARRVETPTGDPTAIGQRTTRHGGFMGKKFSWQTEVISFEPDRLLHMDFIEGPMKGGSVIYRIEADGAGSNVSIRNTGPGPQIMGWFVRRSVRKDLDRLSEIVRRAAP